MVREWVEDALGWLEASLIIVMLLARHAAQL